MVEKDVEKIEVTCSKCGHSWETKSKLMFISCPSCCSKTKNTSVEQPKSEEVVVQ